MKMQKVLIAMLFVVVAGLTLNISVVCENSYNEDEIIKKNSYLYLNETQLINLIKEMSNNRSEFCVTFVWLNGTLYKKNLKDLNVTLIDNINNIKNASKLENSLLSINKYGNNFRIYNIGILFKNKKFLLKYDPYKHFELLDDNKYYSSKTLNELINILEDISETYKTDVIAKNIKLLGKYKYNGNEYKNGILKIIVLYNNKRPNIRIEEISEINLNDRINIISMFSDIVIVNDENLKKIIEDIEREAYGKDLNNVLIKKNIPLTTLSYPYFGYKKIEFKNNNDNIVFNCSKEDIKMTQLKIYHINDKGLNLYLLCGNLNIFKYYLKNSSEFDIIKPNVTSYWNGYKVNETIIIKPKRDVVEIVTDPNTPIQEIEGKVVDINTLKQIIKNSDELKNKTFNFYLITRSGLWNTTIDIKDLKNNDYDMLIKNNINIENVKYFPIWMDIFGKYKNYFKFNDENTNENIIKIKDSSYENGKLVIKRIVGNYNMNDLINCYYLGNFDLCKNIGVERLDNRTLKVKSTKNIEDPLKKILENTFERYNLVGVLIVYKDTGVKTNIPSRIRSIDERIKGWTGGKTINDILNDIKGKPEVIYRNCSEYWRTGENFTKYDCVFIVLNKTYIDKYIWDDYLTYFGIKIEKVEKNSVKPFYEIIKNMTIKDLLLKNDMMGILVIHLDNKTKTNIPYRKRTPEEIFNNWTGKTINDVLKDLSKNVIIEYKNCYEYWNGTDGKFVKYKCEFYAINMSAFEVLFVVPKGQKIGNITYKGKPIIEVDITRPQILYVKKVKENHKNKEKKSEKEFKKEEVKIKENMLINYISPLGSLIINWLWGHNTHEDNHKNIPNNHIKTEKTNKQNENTKNKDILNSFAKAIEINNIKKHLIDYQKGKIDENGFIKNIEEEYQVKLSDKDKEIIKNILHKYKQDKNTDLYATIIDKLMTYKKEHPNEKIDLTKIITINNKFFAFS